MILHWFSVGFCNIWGFAMDRFQKVKQQQKPRSSSLMVPTSSKKTLNPTFPITQQHFSLDSLCHIKPMPFRITVFQSLAETTLMTLLWGSTKGRLLRNWGTVIPVFSLQEPGSKYSSLAIVLPPKIVPAWRAVLSKTFQLIKYAFIFHSILQPPPQTVTANTFFR